MKFLDKIRRRHAVRNTEAWLALRGVDPALFELSPRACFAQGDQNIANQAGAAFRSDLNAELQALVTNSSGATAPATTYAHQWWFDTTSNTMKKRNAANSGWIVKGTLDETFLIDRATNTILGLSDVGKTFRATAGFTQTLTAAATLGDGWFVGYRVESGATLVIDPNASENIDGATTKSIVGPSSGFVYCNGTAFYTVGFSSSAGSGSITASGYTQTTARLLGRTTASTGAIEEITVSGGTFTGGVLTVGGITLATPAASTSGTSIDYTGLPTGLKQVNLMLKGVSTSGSSAPMVQIGPSGGIETSSYAGGASNGAGTTTAFTTGFTLKASTHAAADIIDGLYILNLENSSANSWCSSGVGFWSSTSQQGINSASKSIAGVLSRIRFTTIGGADTFDSGEVNISYQ
jgi:hypothetical protein